MQLIVKWRNAKHFLLKNPSVTLKVDGVTATATMQTGSATFDVPLGSASPPIATLTVKFVPTFEGRATETLQIEQHFELQPPGLFGSGGPQPTSYTIRPTGSATSVVQIGRHPLLVQQFSALGIWLVLINTNTVDVTNVQPRLIGLLLNLARPTPPSNVRVLARTDGKPPLYWITATPAICSSFSNTDVICFLVAPQGSPPARADSAFLKFDPRISVEKQLFFPLAQWLATFFGGGLHTNTHKTRFRDHFARAHDPSDPDWKNKPKPWVVLARGWESALVASEKHVALVLPFPSEGSHNDAATAALPTLLFDIHSALIAIGDIAAPDGVGITRSPRLGIAAHSNGGGALFSAIAASPKTFQEIWLFDTNPVQRSIPILERATTARVLFAGFDLGRVTAPHAAASAMKSLGGRIRQLPKPPLSIKDPPGVIAISSSKLAHALVGGGMVPIAAGWSPGLIVLPGEIFNERFEVLHQQIVQGDDADGLHYLTKALRDSVFT